MERLSLSPHILLSDDSQSMGERLKEIFRGLGWSFESIVGDRQLLQAAVSGSYDIVFLNLEMASGSVLQLLRSIKREKPSQAVMVVSPRADSAEGENFIKEGAVDYFAGTIDRNEMRDSVLRVMRFLREESWEKTVCGFMRREESPFEMTARQAAEIAPGIPIVERLFKAGRIDAPTRLRVMLAFQEALINAVEHGDLELDSRWKEDFDGEGRDTYSLRRGERLRDEAYGARRVRFSSAYDGRQLVLTVEDEGPGYCPAQAAALVSSAVPMCYGRGLMLIRASVDEARLENGGRRIVLVKYL